MVTAPRDCWKQDECVSVQAMNNHGLLLIALYFILVLIVFPIANRSRVFSIFGTVKPDINNLIEEIKSSHRLNHSRRYLDSLDPSSSLTYHQARLVSGNVKHLLIMIVLNVDEVTPSRSKYLIQLATNLDEVVTKTNDTGFFLCDATTRYNPNLHNLSAFYPSYKIQKYTESNGQKNSTNVNDRLKMAFVNCSNIGIEVTGGSQLITIFNENVLPYANFERDVREIVRTKLDNKMSSGEYVANPEKWLYLHLHEPTHLRLYQYDITSFRELLVIVLAGAVTFFLVFRLLEPQMRSYSVLFTTVYGGIFFLTCTLCIGRPYTTELRRVLPSLYRVYDPLEAVRFSALTLPLSSFRLMEPHLRSIKCSDYVGFHQLLDSLINSLEIPGYVVSPSLVRYV